MAYHGLDVLDESFLQHFLRHRAGGIAVGKPPVWGL